MGCGLLKTKIAVIGIGLIVPRHCTTVGSSPDACLIAIVDPLPRGAALAEEPGTAHYTSIQELLASPNKPDGAIVCTPNHTHVPLAIELVDGGVHVLLEKPASANVESGQELLDYVSKTGVQILVDHHRRFNPYMVVVREALKAQSLGKIIAVNGLWTFHKPADYFEAPTEWRKGKTEGAVLINLIHEIDLLQYLLGPLIRVHAEATISTRGHEAEEGAALTMKFESGAVGTFIVSDSVPSPYNLESGTGENPFIPKTGVVFYTILGTNASLSVPDMTRYSYDGVDEKTWHAPLTKDNLFVPEGILLDYN